MPNAQTSRRRRVLWPMVFWPIVAVVIGLGVWMLTGSLERNDGVASVFSFFVAGAGLLVAIYGAFFAPGARGGAPAAAALADDLAAAVRSQWYDEAEARKLFEPRAIRLSWSATRRPVADRPETIAGSDLGGPPVRLRLDGRLSRSTAELATRFLQLPSQRLVILGEPGAGKSVLAILLTLGLLETRRPGGRLPVPLSVASWDPVTEHLYTWMVRSLATHYGGRQEHLQVLIDHRLLIPVLDGLDEMPELLRPAAIRAINRTAADGLPVVLTCRSTEYEQANEAEGMVMRRAAVVEIEPVTVAEAVSYLKAVDWPAGTDWAPIYRELQAHPDGPLATAFSTPLMVSIAREVYGKGGDPGELLDPRRFGHREAIEDELLDMAILAAYQSDPRPPPPGVRRRPVHWTARQVEEWLTLLAKKMHDGGKRDFSWWRLGEQFVPGSLLVIVGIVSGCLVWLSLLLLSTVEPGANDDAGSAAILAGIIAVVICGASSDQPPRRLAPPWQGSFPRVVRRLAIWVAILTLPVMLGMFMVSLTFLLPSAEIIGEFAEMFAEGMPVLGVLAAALGTHVWLSAPPERAAQVSPRLLLAQDRAGALIAALAAGIVGGLMLLPMHALSRVLLDARKAFAIPAKADDVDSDHIFAAFYLDLRMWDMSVYAPFFAVITAVCVLLMRAWPKFVIARWALAARRRLPLRLVAFLDDARERELLRQVGGSYQFRHARLQERLIVRQVHPSPVAPKRALGGLVQRLVISTLAAAALVAAAVVVVTWNQARCAPPWSLTPQTRLQRMPLGDTYECVGILEAGEYDRLGRPPGADQAGFRPAYEMIRRTNAAAVTDPRHRSIVVAAKWSIPDIESRTAHARYLRAIALAQRALLRAGRPVQLIIAAESRSREEAASVVWQSIRARAQRDSRLRGVVRLRTPEAAFQGGYPNSDGLIINGAGHWSETTFDLVPSTSRVRDVLRHYVDRYTSSPTNWLVASDSGIGFAGPWPETSRLRRLEPTVRAGERVCAAGRDAVVVYGASDGHLADFMDGLQKGCRGRYPLIVTDLSRARALDRLKGGHPSGLRLAYATTPGALAWRDCLSVRFYQEYRRAFGPGDSTCAHDADGRAAEAHDLFLTMAAAMFTARGEADFADTYGRLPPAVARLDGSTAVGVRGPIAFAAPRPGRGGDDPPTAPVRTPLLVVETDGGTPRPRLLCGTLTPAPVIDPDPRCPATP